MSEEKPVYALVNLTEVRRASLTGCPLDPSITCHCSDFILGGECKAGIYKSLSNTGDVNGSISEAIQTIDTVTLGLKRMKETIINVSKQ